MNEVKNPKKPLVYYYAIVILVILALNFLAVPWLSQRQVKEVDYGTFMTMTENKEIGRVEVQDNHISIDFHVIVAYGVSICAVSDNLIASVKYKVEEFTGMEVDKINIYVEGVRVID